MKQWNWKRLIQVVLILLLLVSISTQLYRCATTKTNENILRIGFPHLKITYKKKPYPLDHVKVDLSIGITDLSKSGKETNDDDDTFYALYFTTCTREDLLFQNYTNLDISDYKNLENHYFIKEISAQDAASTAYGYYDINGRTIFKQKESLVIPQEVLEQYKREDKVILACFGYTQTDGKLDITSAAFVSIHCKIVDGKYVQFYL